MTIDERLEALTTNLEIISGMVKDLVQNGDKLHAEMLATQAAIQQLSQRTERLEDLTQKIGELALRHERRLDKIDGGE